MLDTEIQKEYRDLVQIKIPLKKTDFTDDQRALLLNPKYQLLIRIIHEKRSLTFDELFEEYLKIDTLSDHKSESTIYRSLQTLKEYDLAVEVGQRVTEGQILTKTLYSLSAEYIILDYEETDWESDKGKEIFSELLKMYKIMYKDNTIHEMKIYNWLIKYQKLIAELHHKLVNSVEPKILENISIWSYPNILLLFKNSLNFFILVDHPELLDELNDCFLSTNCNLKPTEVFRKKEHSNLKKNYQDVFLKVPDIYFVVESENPIFQQVDKSELRKMITIMETGPNTVNEIIKKYNEISINEKKSSTIYRYIKLLKEVGIVMEAGQRVVQGKKATEKLLTLSGKWIISPNTFNTRSEGSYLQLVADKTSDFFLFLFPEYDSINEQKYRSFKEKTFQIEQEFVKRINDPENIEIKKILLLKPYINFIHLYDPFGDTFLFLNYPTLREDFLKCLEN